jgi:hypothetical protein
MAREFLPVTMWREGVCFWMRMAQINAEVGLRMWQAMGFPPTVALDSAVEAVCEAASHAADVPDPVPPRAAPQAAPKSDTSPAPRRRRAAARKPAARPVPAA